MLNIPLGERFAARIVGYRRDRTGLIDHVAPRDDKDVDYTEETGGRIRLSWYPSDAVEVSVLANVVDGFMYRAARVDTRRNLASIYICRHV